MTVNDHGWRRDPAGTLLPAAELPRGQSAMLDVLTRLCGCPTLACAREATGLDGLCDVCRTDERCQA